MDRSGLFVIMQETKKKSVALPLFSSVALSRSFELTGMWLNNFDFLVAATPNRILRKKDFLNVVASFISRGLVILEMVLIMEDKFRF